MAVVLDRERIEPALVEVARPGGMAMGMPALGMGHRQPSHESGQVAIASGPEDEVEVVGHDAVGQHPHGVARGGVGEDAEEGAIIAVVVEDRGAGDGAVQGVIDLRRDA